MVNYLCHVCDTTFSVDITRYKCECGSPLNLTQSEIYFPIEEIKNRDNNLWRYREALPIANESSIVSLNEGMTPLIPASSSACDHRLKLDFVFPTGSYKDRGASILLSKAREIGIREVVEDSSGNAGAAIAAYSAKADIDCTIYCPSTTSAGKLTQISMHGAKLKLIEGSRAHTTQAVLQATGTTFYASHNWNPFFLEGTKTLAFEITEQLGWKAPDGVICPVGFGSIYLGLYIGFKQLYDQKIIKKIPRLLGVQSEACCPIYQTYRNNQPEIAKMALRHETLAEGIISELPVRSKMIMEAMNTTDGAFTIVSEENIKDGIKILAKQGIYVEPTSAVIVKAFDHFTQTKIIRGNDLIVSVLTGSGLKATDKLTKMLST